MNIEKIIVLDAAANDLELGKSFYDLCEFGVGDHFIDALLSDIASLKLCAGTHSKFHGFFRVLSKIFPFAIYYDIDGSTARIAAILDMRQSPKAISGVLRER